MGSYSHYKAFCTVYTSSLSSLPGDVVGYYVLSSELEGADDGIQMDSDDDSINIYYNEDNGGNPISLGPDSCQVRAGDGGLLTISTSAAPQLRNLHVDVT